MNLNYGDIVFITFLFVVVGFALDSIGGKLEDIEACVCEVAEE